MQNFNNNSKNNTTTNNIEMDKDEALSPEAMERARLRRNQRNSRARKQAYIQDLEQRWGRCVEAAQTTMEMQKAAQKVQEENKLLRAVLHNQGFDDAGIQHAIEVVKRAASGNVTPQFVSSPIQMQMNQNPAFIDWANMEPPFDFVSSYISF